MGQLFVVATPIGNLEDISPRALRVLGEAGLVAAEDTRHSKRLLDHFAIGTPLISYHEHNETQRTERLLGELRSGRDVALVTDAGTPCVSDPGYRIVRAAHDHGIPVVCVPGPSAAIAALSVSGLPNGHVVFRGFFPRKAGEGRKALAQVRGSGATYVFFESPNRLVATLKRVAEELPQAAVCVARELTKVFEEVASGTASELAEHFGAGRVRGECVVLIHASEEEADTHEYTPEELRNLVEEMMAREGLSCRDAVRRVAAELSVPRKAVYAATVKPE